MTILSYVIHVEPETVPEVASRLAALPGCDVHPAVNGDLLIVVAEAPPERAEALDQALAATPGVTSVALVSGFVDDDDEGG